MRAGHLAIWAMVAVGLVLGGSAAGHGGGAGLGGYGSDAASSRPWGRQRLPACSRADERCKILSQKIERLNRRDPVQEAKAAVEAGDFRLGGFNHIGPLPQGWHLPGVDCRRWQRDMVGKWHVNQDVIMPGDEAHTRASVAFITAYNRAMVRHPLFAYPDVCAVEGRAPASTYAGPVTTWGQAARSGVTSNLSKVASDQDINARDPLGLTALEWAVGRDDEAMAVALLAAGASPAVEGDYDVPTALALALKQKRLDLARRLLDRGAQMKGDPRVCNHAQLGPSSRTKNQGCSWAGLIVKAGAFDLLARQAGLEGGLKAIDRQGELNSALLEAAIGKDEAQVEQLMPYAGHSEEDVDRLLIDLFEHRPDLVLPYVAARGAGAARSEAEAGIWRAAAQGGQTQALLFLMDYGADLNLLSREGVARCTASARAGDVEALLACVTEAGGARLSLRAAIRAGDQAQFEALLSSVADLKERGKRLQLAEAVDAGTLAMVQALLKAGANPKAPSHYGLNDRRFYQGPLKTAADAVMAGNDHASVRGSASILAQRAAERGDGAMLAALADAGLRGLAQTAGWVSNVGNPAEGFRPNYFETETSQDYESVPNRAVGRNFEAFRLLVAETARVEGPQSLESVFASAVYSGYNDVLQVILDAGLDLSKVEKPERIWGNLGGLGNPCKPSTARILVQNRLRTDYPPSDYTNWTPLQQFAVGCADARVAQVLVQDGGMDVNEMNNQGLTAVDMAIQYRRTPNIEALRRLGGRTAAEIDPMGHLARQKETRETEDLDLVQSEET